MGKRKREGGGEGKGLQRDEEGGREVGRKNKGMGERGREKK